MTKKYNRYYSIGNKYYTEKNYKDAKTQFINASNNAFTKEQKIKAYEMVYDFKTGDIFLVIGCSFHTAIAVDLREVARSRGARIIEIQEDAAHNVRKILENIKKRIVILFTMFFAPDTQLI